MSPSNQTLCRNGLHLWVEENIHTPKDGRPRCRLCAIARADRCAKASNWKSVKAVKVKKQKMLREYRASRGCLVCGEKDPDVLDLDHRDPSTKSPRLKRGGGGGNPGTRGLSSLSFAALAEELLKCDVLCANCHRRKTAKEQDRMWNTTPGVRTPRRVPLNT